MRWALAWSFYDDVMVPERKLEKALENPTVVSASRGGLKIAPTKASALGCTGSGSCGGCHCLLEKSFTELPS
uniref:Uncharacterized protein n=1 Tax=Knipowitschia caucasica TaxID=637954 RepID=A0AAV2KR13_KNICA